MLFGSTPGITAIIQAIDSNFAAKNENLKWVQRVVSSLGLLSPTRVILSLRR